MPYVSDEQRKFFHTDTARKQGITKEMVKEWDAASKGKSVKKTEERLEIAANGQWQLMVS